GPIDLRLSAPLSDPGWLQADWQEVFRLEFEVFIGDFARPAMDENRATYVPNLFSLADKPLDDGRSEARRPDVFIAAVTPPDDEGFVTFGAHNWNKRGYVRRSRKAIAEVDPGLRRVCGDNRVHVTEFDHLVEVPPLDITPAMVKAWLTSVEDDALRAEYESIVDELKSMERLALIGPLLTRVPPAQVRRVLGLAKPPPDALTIAGYVRELVPDGATIQIGIGEPSMYLPRAGTFDGKVDLGIHTEMAAPGLAKLVEVGVITGKRKTLHRGKAVAIAWSGSDEEDLDIISENPAFEVHDPEHLLDLRTIAKNDNFIAMNNALSVDFIGQINSESVFGPRMINGTGGQPETHIGAILSRGGRAITLLPATALEGAVSRIVPQLEAGSIVTIPRFFADTVVTEHGIARLMGKNHRQRAQELIAVAHPDFRAELRREAKRLLG
ncbi:MAG: acetyl-CoA hydrolase/transferase C-terminal domain-containing protein, partial [Dehalococcoidia bacterium]